MKFGRKEPEERGKKCADVFRSNHDLLKSAALLRVQPIRETAAGGEGVDGERSRRAATTNSMQPARFQTAGRHSEQLQRALPL